jgi:hypothetical protein
MRSISGRFPLLWLALLCTAASAQLRPQRAVAPGPAAGDPSASVPSASYESAFDGYRKFADEKAASWRGSNELVFRLGGWRAFASGRVPDIPQPPAGGSGAKPSPAPSPQSGARGN